MKQKIVIILILFVNVQVLISQNTEGYKSQFYHNTAMSEIKNVLNKHNTNTNYNSIDGTPYESEEFKVGTILNLSNNKSYGLLLRYNIYEDKLEVKKDEKTINVLTKDKNFIVKISGKEYVLTNYNINDENKNGYLELLLKSEKVKLFIRHKKILRSAKKAQSSYEKDMPAKFITNESFFYQIDDKEILVLPRKKQDVLKLFSEKSNDIQNYAKKNRLSFKDKEDLIQLFKYYNTLN